MLSLDHGIDVTRKRSGAADFGESGSSTSKSIRVAYRLEASRLVDETSRAYRQSGRLYVYRGEDVKDGDVIALPEGDFTVRGPAQNNYLQPQNGHDFGVIRFDIDRG
jgi:hypothetical protein